MGVATPHPGPAVRRARLSFSTSPPIAAPSARGVWSDRAHATTRVRPHQASTKSQTRAGIIARTAKNTPEILHLTVLCRTFATSSKKQKTMQLTDKEKALIEAIRRFRDNYPNDKEKLKAEAVKRFNELRDCPDENP